MRGPAPDPAARADEFLRLTQKAAGDLVQSLNSLGLLASPAAEAARTLVREQARYLFMFVVLSVLLEERPGKHPADRATAEALKKAFAAQLLETRRQAQKLLDKALKPGRAELLRRRIADAHGDPFAPYYGSWEKLVKSPEQGPFALFAEAAAEVHFEPEQRRVARERLTTLAMALADELLDAAFGG